MKYNRLSNLIVKTARTSQKNIHHIISRVRLRRNSVKNRPIRNNNCLWRSCLLMDWDKMCNLQRGPSAEPSYQGSVHLAEGFKILKVDERQTPSHGESSHCLWQGELRKIFIKLLIF